MEQGYKDGATSPDGVTWILRTSGFGSSGLLATSQNTGE